MNQAFSKIWVIVILITFIAGGIFAWQYFGVLKEEVEVVEEKEKVEVAEEVITDETANWKTYLNAVYGFEIKYPPGYQYNLYPLETVKGWGFEFYEPGKDPFRIRIYEEQPLLEDYYLGAYYFLDIAPPFEGWINPEIPTSGHRIIKYAESITFGVDNYQGIEGVAAIGMTDPYVSLMVFFQNKNNAYVFEFPGYYTRELLPLGEEKWKEELKKKPNTKIFFQMLSTFRVVDVMNTE